MKILQILRKVLRYSSAALLFVLGFAGIAISVYNPVPLIASYLPLHAENILWTGAWFHIDQAILQSTVSTLHSTLWILATTLSISTAFLLLTFIMLVQSPKDAFRAIGRGIKASPKAFLYSPITFYRKIVKGRTWLLTKIEYLQSESAKWKTTFSILKSPYSLLRAAGFSPQMAVGLLFAGSTVGGGVLVNETILSERSFNRGDSGVYAASVVGNNASLDVPTEYVEGSNTLRIDLGTTPVRAITIENVSVGTVFAGSTLPQNETTVLKISGNPTAEGFTATRLEVGTLIFEKNRCKTLTFSDINAHTIVVRGNASDGQSVAPSPGTARMLAIGGGHHQADAMTTSGGMYDRIWIQAPTSAVNGRIGTLKLSNIYTKGGACELSSMNIGTLKILMNETGAGDGFSTKDFQISTNVTGANLTIEDNVEVSIAEPATIQ